MSVLGDGGRRGTQTLGQVENECEVGKVLKYPGVHNKGPESVNIQI